MKHFQAAVTTTVLLLTLTALFSPAVYPQATFGNISGTVTDPATAAIPNAQVTITDTEHGATYQTGFGEFNATAVVQVDATTRADAQLQIGKSATEVTVTGEMPLLIKDRAEVSTTLTATELEKLPILDRNVTSLLISLPGAGRYSSGSGMAAAENQQADIQTPMNGQLAYSNGFLLDGTENHSNILGLAVVNPNPDALEEFKVTSSNYDAEFGNVSGALLQGTTKSGTCK